MSKRANDLADAIEANASELTTLVAALTPAQWAATTASEQWTTGAVVRHVAGSHFGPNTVQFILGMANGDPLPDITPEQIHEMNAHDAAANANCDQAETLASLKENAAATVAAVRGLSDEQLDRSRPMAFAGGNPLSTEHLIHAIWIGTLGDHVASVRASG